MRWPRKRRCPPHDYDAMTHEWWVTRAGDIYAQWYCKRCRKLQMQVVHNESK